MDQMSAPSRGRRWATAGLWALWIAGGLLVLVGLSGRYPGLALSGCVLIAIAALVANPAGIRSRVPLLNSASRSTRAWGWTVLGAAAFFAVGIGAPSTTQQTAASAKTALSSTSTPAVHSAPPKTFVSVPTRTPEPPSPTSSPLLPGLSGAAKGQVRAILTSATDHYAGLLSQGKAALGTVRYANAFAGLQAMNDPTSAAAQFRDWRSSSNAEGDIETYQEAFGKADSYFTAATEPDAISTWRTDVAQAQSDLTSWINVGVSWQISEKSSNDLAVAENMVTTDLAKARADIDMTVR